jgi:N-acetylglucosaminyldiphosphoundecaprenol N-acetyl-beta-D-mannosaminyltransferase
MRSVNIVAPAVQLFGVRVHAITMNTALDIVDQAVQKREGLHIGVLNAAKLVNMRRDPTLRNDVISSDMILADGIAVVWASRLLGRPLPERVTGIDLMMGMLARGNLNGYSVYCLGATEETSRRVAEQIAVHFPQIKIVGRHHGYFSNSEEPQLIDAIAASRPDILLVAMTSPKKENFMAQWTERMGVPVCHGVGGSFDVLAGKVARAPALWQRMGLEWLFRLQQEPGRLWRRYLTTNTIFCAMVLSELWGRLTRAEGSNSQCDS